VDQNKSLSAQDIHPNTVIAIKFIGNRLLFFHVLSFLRK
jgi:hypothetical protein